ncbi:MAG: PHP domain-containing protein [Acidimicrobiia bacterium]
MDDYQPLRRHFAAMLWHLADLVRADERGRSFRSKAYRRAVWSLDDLSPDLDQPSEELIQVPGIGPGVAALIEEFRRTGRLKQLEALESLYPREVERMRRLPRTNPALLRTLKVQLGVETIDELELAVDAGALTTLRGVGETTVELWHRILDLSPGPGMVPSHRAWAMAGQMRDHLERHLDVTVAEAGQVRRVEDWVAWIDLVVATEDRALARRFLDLTAVASRSDPVDDEVHRLRTHDDVGVTVHLVAPLGFGTALLRATGPGTHVEEVLSDGRSPLATEVEVYRARGLAWVPPAARGLSVERATEVVRVADLRGDLHVHTDWSPDGRVSLLDMVRACLARGYQYLLISDHTKGLRFGGLDEDGVERQARLIGKVRAAVPELALFHGAELNIDPSGALDLADSALGGLDFAVAAVHSRFDLGREEQTKRVIKALGHPVVKVLAHPTGRRIGIRPPLALDLDAVFAAAAEEGVALELNGHRDRLDLSAELAEHALAAGCRLAVNSDAHRLGEVFNVENAVATAQRAGVGPERVVNTLELDDFVSWVESQ